ncbi:MAG TPA: hypothetical protein VLG71_02075 [Candidatus Limnocylindria bacterium]|nr:hypothetical protein [Candidatus Limnocylindria bacterium]
MQQFAGLVKSFVILSSISLQAGEPTAPAYQGKRNSVDGGYTAPISIASIHFERGLGSPIHASQRRDSISDANAKVVVALKLAGASVTSSPNNSARSHRRQSITPSLNGSVTSSAAGSPHVKMAIASASAAAETHEESSLALIAQQVTKERDAAAEAEVLIDGDLLGALDLGPTAVAAAGVTNGTSDPLMMNEISVTVCNHDFSGNVCTICQQHS